MVMSYKGAEAPKVEESQSVKVEDYMARKLVTFRPDQPMFDVAKELMKHRISGGPVVNDDGELVGIVSEGDCLKEVVKGKYDNMPIFSGTAEEHMARNVTKHFRGGQNVSSNEVQEVSCGEKWEVTGPNKSKRRYESSLSY